MIRGSLLACGLISVNLAACADSSSDKRQLVRQYYSQFQKPGFEVDELAKFYADDVAFIDPTFEIEAKGRDEVLALYAEIGTDRTSYEDIDWDLRDIIVDGDNVVISGRWSGKFFECPFDVDFATLWKLQDDLIVVQRDFFAASRFDEQVRWNPESGRAECEN